MTQVPFGFDPVEYDFYSKTYSDVDLENMRVYYAGVEDRYRELKQMMSHILAAREASRMFPSADKCCDVTEEAKRL